MPDVICPSCRLSVPLATLETHLRRELRYPGWECALCGFLFLSRTEALSHFDDILSPHAGRETAILETHKHGHLRRLFQAAIETKSDMDNAASGDDLVLSEEEHIDDDADDATNSSLEDPPMTQEGAMIHQSPDGILNESREPAQPTAEDSDNDVSSEPASHDLQPAYHESPSPSKSYSEEDSLAEPAFSDGVEPPPSARPVTCRLCLTRVERWVIGRHVRSRHIRTRPYACAHCAYAAKLKEVLREHQRRRHKLRLSAFSYTHDAQGIRREIREMRVRCFGEME